jgi:hypothetical protein
VGEKLHTFILGDLSKKDRESGGAATLKTWSQSYHHIWQREFAEILIPRPEDLRAAVGVLQRALQRSSDGSGTDAADRLRRISANVEALIAEFDRLGKNATVSQNERDAWERQLEHARRIHAPRAAVRSSPPTDHSHHLSALDWFRGGIAGGLSHRSDGHAWLWYLLRRVLAVSAGLLSRTLRLLLG